MGARALPVLLSSASMARRDCASHWAVWSPGTPHTAHPWIYRFSVTVNVPNEQEGHATLWVRLSIDL